MAEQKRFDMILGKQRARARLREFIGKHIFDRKNARVLCLPGENGREIEHVYRKLGFRDENIIGLEADESVVGRVRAHYPRINVACAEVGDFCRRYDGDLLGVVSLDYCGSYNWDKITPLADLAFNKKLAGTVVLATNFFVGREKGTSLESMRTMHGAAMLDQRETLEACKILRKPEDPGFPWAFAREDDGVREMRDIALKDAACEMLLDAAPFSQVFGRGFFNTNNFGKLIGDIVVEFKKSRIRNETMMTGAVLRSLARDLVQAFVFKKAEAYIPVAFESYSYVNDNGRRMDCDFSAFRKPLPRELAGIDGFKIYRDGDRIGVALDPHPASFDSLEAYMDAVFIGGGLSRRVSAYYNKQTAVPPERIHLGGGAIPFDSEKTKARAIQLLKKGRSDEEIMSKLPVTVGTLRALKAHITMGTY